MKNRDVELEINEFLEYFDCKKLTVLIKVRFKDLWKELEKS